MKSKTKLMALFVVSMMLAGGLVFLVPADESDATSGDGGTYTYVLTYDPTAMSTTSAAISTADMTPISHSSSTTFESMNKGSWTWDSITGLGPFNSFYGAFDMDDGNKFIGVLNPENLGELLDGTTLASLGGRYNIMWVLPTVYWSASGNTLTLTNDPNAGGTAYAHTIDGHVYNYIAIGVYEASQTSASNKFVITSQSGTSPYNNQTKATFRTYAHNYTMDSSLGDDAYSMLWNFYQWELYKYCSLAVMENFNSQNTVGNGHVYGSNASIQTGVTDTMGPYVGNAGSITDSTSATNYGTDYVKLFIENAWGGLVEFVDGAIFVGNTGVYIDTTSNPTDTTTAGTYVTWNALTMPTSSGYPTQISTTDQTWGWGIGSSYDGTQTTGLCDRINPASSDNKIIMVGGTVDNDRAASVGYGLSFAVTANNTSAKYSSFGSRLAFVFDEGVEPPTATATIESNNTSYGTVSNASITDIEPGTSVTISQDGLTLTIGAFGSSVATPTASTAQYTYALSGWYVNNVALQTGDTINEDVTIEARFTQAVNQYTVTFSAGFGGTVSPASVTVDYGTAITATDNVVTVGITPITATPDTATAQYTYTFDSWTNATGTVTADRTITANFTQTINEYTISFASEDLSYGSVDVSSIIADYGMPITVSNNTITIDGTTVTATAEDGFRFVEWTPAPAASVTGTATYTATFSESVSVTVTFNGNGGTVIGSSTKVVLSGDPIGNLPNADRTNYDFIGWFTAAEGGTQITEDSIIETEEDFTLYAQYKLMDSAATFKMLIYIVPTMLFILIAVGLIGYFNRGRYF